MRNSKIQSFFAAFALTLILIGALCGFAAVDISTDRYMPNQFGPLFEIARIHPETVEFSFLAKNYILQTKPDEDISAFLKKYRGLLPALPQMLSSLASDGVNSITKQIKAYTQEK